MSVFALFGAKLVVQPPSSAGSKVVPRVAVGGGGGLVIECSSRPQKKATKHHMKTRPRKTSPADIRRRPTVYPPLPPLPPEWSLVSGEPSVSGETPPPAPVQTE